MQSTLFQNIFLVFELFVAIGCLAYIVSLTISLWKGAPFVPSKSSDFKNILRKLQLEKGAKFLELGCGDGRVVCHAVKEYEVLGRGVDISPLWLACARFRARLMGISDRVEFRVEDIVKTDVAWADVIYLYMMPSFLGKHAEAIFSKCRPGTIIISYVFDIPILKEKEQKDKGEERYYIYRI